MPSSRSVESYGVPGSLLDTDGSIESSISGRPAAHMEPVFENADTVPLELDFDTFSDARMLFQQESVQFFGNEELES